MESKGYILIGVIIFCIVGGFIMLNGYNVSSDIISGNTPIIQESIDYSSALTWNLDAHNIVRANPVMNTWYVVTNQTGGNYRPLACDVQVGVANEDLGFRVTIDGWVLYGTQTAATFGSNYRLYIAWDKSSIYLNSGTGIIGLCYYITSIECHQFIFEVRKTTNNGAGNLNALAIWEYR